MQEFKNIRARLPAIVRASVVGIPAGFLFDYLRTPIPWMIGPMIAVAALTMAGVRLSAVPHALTDFAQLMFGLVLGARYERAFFARYKLFIPFALLNSFFILICSVAAGALLAWLFRLPIATMIIATSPGGLAEMTITAQALQISVPLVVAFHLFRVVVVNMGTQYIYAWSARVLRQNPASAPQTEPAP